MKLQLHESLKQLNGKALKDTDPETGVKEAVILGEYLDGLVSMYQCGDEGESLRIYDLGCKIAMSFENDIEVDLTEKEVKDLDAVVCKAPRMSLVVKGQLLKLLRAK